MTDHPLDSDHRPPLPMVFERGHLARLAQQWRHFSWSRRATFIENLKDHIRGSRDGWFDL